MVFAIGQKVRIVKGIYEDGQDRHPAGWIAKPGETVTIVGMRNDGTLACSHDWASGRSFFAYPHEVEPA